MEHARLIVHRGAVRVTRDQLTEVPTPPATPTWKPIPHALLVSALHEECGRRGMQVVQEEYAVQLPQPRIGHVHIRQIELRQIGQARRDSGCPHP